MSSLSIVLLSTNDQLKFTTSMIPYHPPDRAALVREAGDFLQRVFFRASCNGSNIFPQEACCYCEE